jgi:hypothetical protein
MGEEAGEPGHPADEQVLQHRQTLHQVVALDDHRRRPRHACWRWRAGEEHTAEILLGIEAELHQPGLREDGEAMKRRLAQSRRYVGLHRQEHCGQCRDSGLFRWRQPGKSGGNRQRIAAEEARQPVKASDHS